MKTGPPRQATVEQLLGRVEWAIEQGLPNRDVVAISEKLIEQAAPGSAEARIGRLRLAQSSVAREPWRAALLARELTQHAESAEEWGTLGLALTKLGHFRAAIRAYRKALAIEPGCSVCCHNLGHLLDVALARPADALGYLRRARELLPHEPEVAGSYAHALLHAGQPEQARQVLKQSGLDEERVSELLGRWTQRTG